MGDFIAQDALTAGLDGCLPDLYTHNTLLAEHENGHLCCPSFCVSGSARHSTVIEEKKSMFYRSWNGKIYFFPHSHVHLRKQPTGNVWKGGDGGDWTNIWSVSFKLGE